MTPSFGPAPTPAARGGLAHEAPPSASTGRRPLALSGVALSFAVAGSVVGGCSEPRILEQGADLCRDGVDNDGDGRADCDDDDCALSPICERTPEACRNDSDDDDDSAVDCADPDCVRAGYCEPFDATCPRVGEGDGCPKGMTCVPSDDDPTGRRCVRPGTATDWSACSGSSDCNGGRTCTDGVCEWVCQRTVDCPSGSLCVARAGGFATCALPCAPRADDERCPGACRSLSELGYVYGSGMPLSACVLAPGDSGGRQEGEPCDEDRASRCSTELVCHPEATGYRCRSICAALPRSRAELVVECPVPLSCVFQDMDTSNPPYGIDTYLTGLCLPSTGPR